MVIAIGASTGGVEALRTLISGLPADAPAMLVAQHMPAHFTATFAARLNAISSVRVTEAAHGDRLLPGHVYIAPGGFHLRLGRSGANYICEIGEDPPVSGHRPSVNALFFSVAEKAGKSAIGVILTGMGRDGADGLLKMREAGAHTVGEHESTAMIYGMPKAAFQIGATVQELPIQEIGPHIMALSSRQRLRI
jgi:two-component system chemotaxis response regulator CheB